MDKYRLQTIAGILNENDNNTLEELKQAFNIFNKFYIEQNKKVLIDDIKGMNEWVSLITNKYIYPLEINLNDKFDYFFDNFNNAPKKVKYFYNNYNFKYFNGSFKDMYFLFKCYFYVYIVSVHEFLYEFYIDKEKAMKKIKENISTFGDDIGFSIGEDDEGGYDINPLEDNTEKMYNELGIKSIKPYINNKFPKELLFYEYMKVIKNMDSNIKIIGANDFDYNQDFW